VAMLGAPCSACCPSATGCSTFLPNPLPDSIEMAFTSTSSDYASYAGQMITGDGAIRLIAVGIACRFPSGTFSLTPSTSPDDYYFSPNAFSQGYVYVNDILGVNASVRFERVSGIRFIRLALALRPGRLRYVEGTLTPPTNSDMLSDSWATSACFSSTLQYFNPLRNCTRSLIFAEIGLQQECDASISQKAFGLVSGAGSASWCFSDNCIPPGSFSGAGLFTTASLRNMFGTSLNLGFITTSGSPRPGDIRLMSTSGGIVVSPAFSPNPNQLVSLTRTFSAAGSLDSIKMIRGSDSFDLFGPLPAQSACCGSFSV
jgi:hypothetical protein